MSAAIEPPDREGAPTQEGHEGSAEREPGERRRTIPGGPIVLIVDDVPDNLLAFEGMLRRGDIEIVTANSGADALEVLLEREVAVAIVDVQMPDMDGLELASLMRGVEKTKRVPIILITAGSHDGARVFRGYEAGAVDYLYKPIDEHVLRGKVDVFVELAKQRLALEEAERMREMFIAVLGHDLRNPLSGIQMVAQLIQRRSEGEDIDEPIERILRSSKRMFRMIEQLLDATRFRNDGQISVTPEPTDLRPLIDQILSELDHQADQLHTEVHGNVTGTWDADRILQILSNLVGNAARHSPPDSRVQISVDGRSEDDVTFSVHNGGPPIPDELRNVLFEPFRRANLGHRRQEGLGLGLYITERLVDAHGGTVTFESNEESGTRFTVVLPRHVRASEDDATVRTPRYAVETTATRGAPEASILIVEDEAGARHALAELLASEGYRVLTAASPSEALAAADREGPVDLLLSDVRLPEMNGNALAQRLRMSYPDMRVVFISGLPEPPGAQDMFVQKPIDLDHLVNVIERALASINEANA